MAVAACAAMVGVNEGFFWLFFCSFIAMFVLTGIGNGAIYRMIPLIFAAQAREHALRTGVATDGSLKAAKRQAAAVVGVTGSVGAFGGVLVNLVFKFSLDSQGSLTPALLALLGFYAVCLTTTWWHYLRQSFAIARTPNLAYANV